MNKINILWGVVSKPKYVLAAFFSSMAFWILLAATSNIMSFAPGGIEVNPLAEPGRILITIVTSVLFGLNAGVLMSGYEMKGEVASATSRVTVIGALTALFTSSCPVCHPLLLAGLGLGCIGSILGDLSLWIGLFSIVMLAISLNGSLDSAAGICPAKNKKR